MTNDTGTLAELGVKEGDKLECLYNNNSYFVEGELYECYQGYDNLDRRCVGPKNPRTGAIPMAISRIVWKLISRALEEPKTWGQMTDEEKGALLLAKHEGKVIEWYCTKMVDGGLGQWSDCPIDCLWNGDEEFGLAYRVKPETVVDTVVITNFHESARGYHIKFEVKDGEPDCGSVKMEKL